MIKKELVVHIETNEEGEFIKVSRIDTEPGFYLLSLGQVRLVINGAELVDALNSIGHYSTLFDEELRRKQQAKAAPPKTVVLTAPKTTKGKKTTGEEEGTIVLDAPVRLGPTESELALERQTKHMKGESLVFKEK